MQARRCRPRGCGSPARLRGVAHGEQGRQTRENCARAPHRGRKKQTGPRPAESRRAGLRAMSFRGGRQSARISSRQFRRRSDRPAGGRVFSVWQPPWSVQTMSRRWPIWFDSETLSDRISVPTPPVTV